jgi:HD-GYP domain-containing protein (c-di-GMP phosphodiesterase class II)
MVVGPASKSEFYKIPVGFFGNGEKIDADVFFYHQQQYILFKSKGGLWSPADAQKLESTHVENLFMKFNTHREHHLFIQDKLKRMLERRDITVEAKAEVLYQTAEPILSTIFTTPSSAELITSAADYTKTCIKYLNQKGSLPELVKLSMDSFSEHAHGLQVSAYSIALAKAMGFVEEKMLFGLGMGSLLHDIGKSKIPASILNKPKELDETEWALMRQHPEWGEKILDQRQLVPLIAKQVVLEHHERVNGKGYPKGLKNIHIFSKIVGIADCFHSLTSERPYAKALPPFEALKLMIQTMGREFDPLLLEKFIQMLSKS